MSSRGRVLCSSLVLMHSVALAAEIPVQAPPLGVRRLAAAFVVPTLQQDHQNASPQAPTSPSAATAPAQQLVVPAGTRLPLVLRNGINTRTAKSGDSIYFETIYPIAVNNRIVIPIGSFLRGQLLESKRPGFIKGRGQIRMVLDQMTFPNGYTVALAATPSSADRDGKEGVDKEGTIQGRSGAGRDAGLVLVATGGGAYIGTLLGAALNAAPGRGALLGGGAGAAGAIIAILATRGPEAELARGTTLDVVFNRPLLLDAALLPGNEPGHLSAPLVAPQPAQQPVQRRPGSLGLPLRAVFPRLPL